MQNPSTARRRIAVVGSSGAGKTTLMQLLACARPPSAGRLLLDGIDPWTLPRPRLQHLRGQLFLAPQVPPLPPRQRVVTAVLAGCLPRWSFGKSLRSLVYPADIPAAEAALGPLPVIAEDLGLITQEVHQQHPRFDVGADLLAVDGHGDVHQLPFGAGMLRTRCTAVRRVRTVNSEARCRLYSAVPR